MNERGLRSILVAAVAGVSVAGCADLDPSSQQRGTEICDYHDYHCDKADASVPDASVPDARPPNGGDGCALTQGYWKTHNEEAKNESQQIDWPAPLDEDDELCSQSLLDILHTPPKGGNAWYILAHQAIAAALNVASGAPEPDELDDAFDLLEATCAGMTAGQRADAIDLADALADYNEGDDIADTCHDGGDERLF